MAEDIIDLFSDSPDASLTLAAGTYAGKQSIRRYFESVKEPNPEFMHQVMQLSGVVTVEADGKTAKGRWYGFGAVAAPVGDGMIQVFMGGIYGGDYVKEDGTWKFKKLRFDHVYSATPAIGWVKPDRLAKKLPKGPVVPHEADIPRTGNSRYPSGYIFPFHYKHPVTGKETSENKRNALLK
ncbi:MAG: nuclear transport factor 2 family protein [Deltaproteobacteria bacterium]|nr:nuclear transport factor 2 family protein [Deltaproteobacteria bacterium]